MSVRFKSTQPYLQVDKGAVNRAMAVTGFRFNMRTGKYENTEEIAGLVINNDGLTTEQSCEMYLFTEGYAHDELTLEDPKEIENMRAYAQGRHDDLIVEIME